MRLVAVIGAAALAVGSTGAGSAEDPAAAAARGALIAQFESDQLVAFGGEHQDTRQHAFLRALVRDPRFAAAVDESSRSSATRATSASWTAGCSTAGRA